MAEISRVDLFHKLNRTGYQSIESATTFCKMRGNPYVELAHWIHQLLQLDSTDWHQIIRHFKLETGQLSTDLTDYLDKLPRGASSISDFSSFLEESIERGWVFGTLMFKDSAVRSGYLMIGILKTKSLANVLYGISSEFRKVSADALSDSFTAIMEKSIENGGAATDGSRLGDTGGGAPGSAAGSGEPAMGEQDALARYAVDMTQQARDGEIDPIVGRDEEIRQIVDILLRRRQNNPILTGEAGVGKTAVVEGFANKLASGDVPPPLQGVRLMSLDIGLLQAGASMKGEFENRLRQVIEEVQSSETPIIMFIDEAHTLIGAGGAAGTGDAANLLKPALARGTLRTIAATTWAEYKKHIEKDPALTRRFQVVQILEPEPPNAVVMMRAIAPSLEKHHKILILDEALEASVHLSSRYIPARQLPDKSVSLLDTACARVSLSQHAIPASVEDSRRKIQHLETEARILSREAELGKAAPERIERVQVSISNEQEHLGDVEAQWEKEKEIVGKITALRGQLHRSPEEPDSEEPAPPEDAIKMLEALQTELSEVQGTDALVHPCADHQAVASVVADWTGIPVGKMMADEIRTVLDLVGVLNQRVIGQDHGLEMIAKRVQTSRAELENPNKPIGVFMLAGPSGVGKTETACALAETLYGGEHNLITINMSEFQEAHTVSTLKGAPPGYVGYGEGGVLTEAVRRKPYSVVLLDEVEKAHSDVHEIFFQVFDKGVMEDGEGRVIDFKNTIILLTSNVGSDLIMNMCKDPDLMPEPEAVAEALREPLLKVFPAALLGRLVTIPYYPLSDKMIGMIAGLQLNRVKKRVLANHGVDFNYDDSVVELIVSRCKELESGGRMIDAILTNTMLPAISREFLTRMMEGEELTAVNVTVEDDKFSYRFAGEEVAATEGS
jgi:type VI secretion system protein VasG